jgi:cytochrome b6-f complex iron-sulfur subunit
MPVSRRRFCVGACQAASGVAFATMFSACGGASSSPTGPSGMASPLGTVPGRLAGSTVQVTVAGSALADAGGAVLVESNAGVFLLSRAGGDAFTAVEAVCTHEGCTVNGAAGDIYVCPCHGSRYNRSGQVVNGPAKANLRRYSSSFANGVVTIAL